MSDFITLSCPSCGAKLEITQDINRFACSSCGREHIVNRSGGIVALSPVVDAINQVKSGVDKTAAELALERISKEIEALIAEKNRIMKESPYPTEYSVTKLVVAVVIGVLFLIIPIIFISQGDNTAGTASLLCGIPGIALIILGMWPILNRSTKRLEAQQNWEAKTGVRIKSLNEQIESKQLEYERNRELVSQ